MKRILTAAAALLVLGSCTQQEEQPQYSYTAEFSEYTTTEPTTTQTTQTEPEIYSYFDHAYFIGDRLCESLTSYGLVPESNVFSVYSTAQGLSYEIADISDQDSSYFYLSIGALDIANAEDPDAYAASVLECANSIRERLPQSTVIILGTTPIKQEIQYRTYTNEDGEEYSVAIEPDILRYNRAVMKAVESSLDMNIHYIDICVALADSKGLLSDRSDSGDGTLLSAEGAKAVLDLLDENRYTDFISWEDRYRYMHPDFYSPGRPDYEVTPGKVVYLTFDDGPSKYTPEVLDILKANDIKATFFVTGWTIPGKEDILKREADEGHTIGLHSQTHEYDQVYASAASFFDEFDQVNSAVMDITGIKPWCLRFPGGSINNHNKDTRDAVIKELNRRGYAYFDWNCATLDATGEASVEYCLESLKTSVTADHSVLLMHDAVEYTPQYLQDAIDYLRSEGYTFETVDTADDCHFKK